MQIGLVIILIIFLLFILFSFAVYYGLFSNITISSNSKYDYDYDSYRGSSLSIEDSGQFSDLDGHIKNYISNNKSKSDDLGDIDKYITDYIIESKKKGCCPT